MSRLLLPGLHFAERRSAVVFGRLVDPCLIAWKPAGVPLTSQEAAGGVAVPLQQQLTEHVRQPLFLPGQLEREEGGLQLATLRPHADAFLQRTLTLGLWRQGYAAVVSLPSCLLRGGPFQGRVALPGAWGEDGKLRDKFRLRAAVRPALAAPRRRNATGTDVGKLFTGAGAACEPDPDCPTCRLALDADAPHPFAPSVALMGVAPAAQRGPAARSVLGDVSIAASVVGISTQRGCALLRVSSAAASAHQIRALLAAAGLPVLHDPLYCRRYAGEVLARAGPSPDGTTDVGSVLWRGHCEPLLSTGGMPLGLARTALQVPDPGDEGNRALMRQRSPPRAPAAWASLQVTLPLPLGWGGWLQGGHAAGADPAELDAEGQWAARHVSARHCPGGGAGGAAQAEDGAAVPWQQGAQPRGGPPARAQQRAARWRRRCECCGSAAHTAAQCTRLNSTSRYDEFAQQLGELAGLPQAGLFCPLCGEEGHAIIACPRRRRGVDPETHCAFCGSASHTLWECRAAAGAGLARREPAEAYARRCGFSGWDDMRRDAQRRRAEWQRGTEPSYRVTPRQGREAELQQLREGGNPTGGGDDFARSAPYSTQRSESVVEVFRGVKAQRRARWFEHNVAAMKQRRIQRRAEQDEGYARAVEQAGGTGLDDPIPVEYSPT
eukprot:TRINITY_DN17368_c0_g1_i1.p1 TRINITY_DN17368_c0_g1~~TRINITY_DN17368_c0_g1_i1.p1  ORF type:complete len:691 (+),score=210.51 TRINITY_DN17368_c0_g1_i1:83-2074(+)